MAKESKTAANAVWDEIVSECRYMSVALLIIALAFIGLVTATRFVCGCAVDAARDFVKAEIEVQGCLRDSDRLGFPRSERSCRGG